MPFAIKTLLSKNVSVDAWKQRNFFFRLLEVQGGSLTSEQEFLFIASFKKNKAIDYLELIHQFLDPIIAKKCIDLWDNFYPGKSKIYTFLPNNKMIFLTYKRKRDQEQFSSSTIVEFMIHDIALGEATTVKIDQKSSECFPSATITPLSNGRCGLTVEGQWDNQIISRTTIFDSSLQPTITLENSPRAAVTSLVSLSRELVVFGFKNGKIEIWNTDLNKREASWQAHKWDVTALAISSKGILASGSKRLEEENNDTLKLWDIHSKKLKCTLRQNKAISKIIFLKGGLLAACSGEGYKEEFHIQLWNLSHFSKKLKTQPSTTTLPSLAAKSQENQHQTADNFTKNNGSPKKNACTSCAIF